MKRKEFAELKRESLQFFEAIAKIFKQRKLRAKELGYRIKSLEDCKFQIEALSYLLSQPMDECDLARTLAKVSLLLKEVFKCVEPYYDRSTQEEKLTEIALEINQLYQQITPLIQQLDPKFIPVLSQKFLDNKVKAAKAHVAEKSVLEGIRTAYELRYSRYNKGLFGRFYGQFKVWNRQKDRLAELDFIEAVDRYLKKNNSTISSKDKRIIRANTLILVRLKIKAETVNQLPFCRSELVAIINQRLHVMQSTENEQIRDDFLDFLTKANIKIPQGLQDFFYQDMELIA